MVLFFEKSEYKNERITITKDKRTYRINVSIKENIINIIFYKFYAL
jgi:hypothetical protein